MSFRLCHTHSSPAPHTYMWIFPLFYSVLTENFVVALVLLCCLSHRNKKKAAATTTTQRSEVLLFLNIKFISVLLYMKWIVVGGAAAVACLLLLSQTIFTVDNTYFSLCFFHFLLLLKFFHDKKPTHSHLFSRASEKNSMNTARWQEEIEIEKSGTRLWIWNSNNNFTNEQKRKDDDFCRYQLFAFRLIYLHKNFIPYLLFLFIRLFLSFFPCLVWEPESAFRRALFCLRWYLFVCLFAYLFFSVCVCAICVLFCWYFIPLIFYMFT